MVFNENGKIINEGLFSKIKEKYNNYHKKHADLYNKNNQQPTFIEPEINDEQAKSLNKWIENSYKKYYNLAKTIIVRLNQKYSEIGSFTKQHTNDGSGIQINKWNSNDFYMYDVKDDMEKGKVRYDLIYININFKTLEYDPNISEDDFDNFQVSYTKYMNDLLSELNDKNNDENISFEDDGGGNEAIIIINFDIVNKIKNL